MFIGVLFDLYSGGKGGEGEGGGLPWGVTVHFSDFPSKSLVRCENVKVMKDHYFQCLKEACTLRHKSNQGKEGGGGRGGGERGGGEGGRRGRGGEERGEGCCFCCLKGLFLF